MSQEGFNGYMNNVCQALRKIGLFKSWLSTLHLRGRMLVKHPNEQKALVWINDGPKPVLGPSSNRLYFSNWPWTIKNLWKSEFLIFIEISILLFVSRSKSRCLESIFYTNLLYLQKRINIFMIQILWRKNNMCYITLSEIFDHANNKILCVD